MEARTIIPYPKGYITIWKDHNVITDKDCIAFSNDRYIVLGKGCWDTALTRKSAEEMLEDEEFESSNCLIILTPVSDFIFWLILQGFIWIPRPDILEANPIEAENTIDLADRLQEALDCGNVPLTVSQLSIVIKIIEAKTWYGINDIIMSIPKPEPNDNDLAICKELGIQI